MKFILDMHDKVRPLFEKGGKHEKLWPLFDAQDTFAFTPSDVTGSGAHVRDAVDLKRVMITVVLALFPAIVFGIWNAGHLHNTSSFGVESNLMADLFMGLQLVLPVIITSYAVGGFWEVLFAIVRRHEINEGFLVTGMLFPLVLPPTIPLWQVAVGVSFGVVIGKEVFGGTGMNILNPALTARAYLFFAHPGDLSGDKVWTSLVPAGAVDGFSGATALAVAAAAEGSANIVETLSAAGFTLKNMFIGTIPGSIGETSTLCILIGAAILLIAGVGSWRIMLSMLIGTVVGGLIANAIGATPFSQLPVHYHIVMGGFAFGCVFMATDPVSAAATNPGKWIYGFLTGLLVIIIRLANKAYPEGVMLAILFMNVMAPMIDHYVVQAHIKKRRLAHA